MKSGLAAIAASFLVAGGSAAAAPPAQRPEAFQALTRCRAIGEPAERFACLERSAAALEAAADKGEIVIIDRQQIRTTKRTLFGLPIPSLEILGGGGPEEEISQVEGTLAGASRDADSRWILRLADGARWQQIDDRVLPLSPKAGDKVTIRRASLGTFMMQIRGRAGIRVKRLE